MHVCILVQCVHGVGVFDYSTCMSFLNPRRVRFCAKCILCYHGYTISSVIEVLYVSGGLKINI